MKKHAILAINIVIAQIVISITSWASGSGFYVKQNCVLIAFQYEMFFLFYFTTIADLADSFARL